MPAPEPVILTGADAAFDDLLADWYAALRDAGVPAGRIGVLDLGLDADRRATLAADGVALVRPRWDLPFRGQADAPPWFKAMVARPFLPRHFPGHSIYLWIDCDAWVADPTVLDEIAAAAMTADVAVAADRFDAGVSYLASSEGQAPTLRTDPADRVRAIVAETYRACFADPDAGTHAAGDVINVGVLAARADSPVWAGWQARLAQGLAAQGWRHRMVEQQALNLMLLTAEASWTRLPARANWNLGTSWPMLDPLGYDLMADAATRVGILHLTTLKGLDSMILRTTTGASIKVPTRYRQFRDWRSRA